MAKAAESTASQARVALGVLLGLPRPVTEVSLDDSLEALCAGTPPADNNPQAIGRPDVVAAEATLRKAEADLRLQKSNRIPDPTFVAQYEHEPPEQPNTVGLGLSFPLPLWNHNRGNILAGQAAREQASLAFEKAQAQAAADITTARLSYDSALQRWRSYRDSIRLKSESVRKTVAYAYEKGAASLVDLLVAERNDNEVRLAQAQAASDTALALAALKAATETMQTSNITK